MNAKQMWIGGIILVLFSFWLGVEIGVSRDWIAGIFLYVIPAITITSLTILSLRSKADEKVNPKKDIQFVIEQLEDLRKEIYKINEFMNRTNNIEIKIDSVEKKISDLIVASASTSYTKGEKS